MFTITFINIPGHKDIVTTVYPPVGILSMAACLKKEGYAVHYIDTDVCRLRPGDVTRLLSENRPDLIGISLNVSQVSHSVEYIKEIQAKFPKIPIILGGPYVTGVQEKIFKDFPSLKFAVIKEGEYAILDFVEYLAGQKSIEEVRNLIWNSHGKIRTNNIERIRDLDELPLPDYELVIDIIDKYPGAYPTIASPSVAIMATRGCPYNCTFCSSPHNWDRKLTIRSVDSIIEEIKYLKKLIDVKEIFFQDDTLNVRVQWFYELCDKIISHGLNEDIFYKCPFRVNKNILDQELLKKAKEANFWMIFYGVENGNQKMLDSMNKNISLNEIKRAFRLTRKAGICSYASLMIGNYRETEETVKDSIKLIQKIMPDFGGFAIAAPFPGTQLYEIAQQKNLLLLDDFKKYQFGDCIVETEKLKKDDIVRLFNFANEKFLQYQQSLRYKIASRKNVYKKIKEEGFYEKEVWHAPVRRTGKKVYFTIPQKSKIENSIVFKIFADHPDISEKPVIMTLWINAVKYKIVISESKWMNLTYPVVHNKNDDFVYIKWKVDRTWNPKKYGINEDDNRELGITVESVFIKDRLCNDCNESLREEPSTLCIS